jgi:hypothetical protein
MDESELADPNKFKTSEGAALRLKLCPHALLPSAVMHEVRTLAIDGDQIFASASLPVFVKPMVVAAAAAAAASRLEGAPHMQFVEVLSPTPHEQFIFEAGLVSVTVRLNANNVGATTIQVR